MEFRGKGTNHPEIYVQVTKYSWVGLRNNSRMGSKILRPLPQISKWNSPYDCNSHGKLKFLVCMLKLHFTLLVILASELDMLAKSAAL